MKKNNKKTSRGKTKQPQTSAQRQVNSATPPEVIQKPDKPQDEKNTQTLFFRYPPPPKYDDILFDAEKSTQQKSVIDEILGSWNAHEVDPEYDNPSKSEVDFNNTKLRGRYMNWIENVYHLLHTPPQVEKVISFHSNFMYFSCYVYFCCRLLCLGTLCAWSRFCILSP